MDPVIQKTTDYSIFKFVNFNRDKKKSHISRIKSIIQKENLLHLHPIIVNNDMELIDGQHRLAAAQELGVPVYYIKGDVSYTHILDSNEAQRKSELLDVIKFYVFKDKLPSYITLYRYTQTLGIKPKAVLGLMFGVINKPLIEFIKSGKFEMPVNMEKLEKIFGSYLTFRDFVREKRITPTSMFVSSYFTIGFRNLVLLDDFIEQVWMNKLSLRWFDLKPQMNAKEWTRQLISIYNWKNHVPIQFNG